MNDTKFFSVAIIGAGPAGLSAAVNASSEGLSVALIESQDAVGGQAKYSSRIENYLGFPSGLTGGSLMSRAANQAAKFGAKFLLGETVEEVGREGKFRTIQLASGTEIITKAVLVSCGLAWRKLQAEGIDKFQGHSVFYGANREDALRYAGKRVVIVGAANSAGQAAMNFSNKSRVTIICRGGGLNQMSQYLVDRINKNGKIDIVTQASVIGILGKEDEDHLHGVQVRQGDKEFCIECDAVFIFIGAEPRTDWLHGACERDERGYVVTGADKMTSCDGVFCAGDVRSGSTKRIASGVGEGAQAVGEIHKYLERIGGRK